MRELSDEYLLEAERRARRFAGAYTGTSGTLAGDVLLLLKELKRMESQTLTPGGHMSLEDANAALRAAVEERTLPAGGAAQAATDLNKDEMYIINAAKELKDSQALPGDGIAAAPAGDLRPGSAAVLQVLDEAGQLHLRKTLDYGDDADALRNIREGAELIGVPSWQACLIRLSDKMSRMRSYCKNGRVEFDGVEDNLIDMVSYAAICLAEFRRESKDG